MADQDATNRIDPIELPPRMRTVIARLGRHLRQTRAGADLSPTQYQVLATVVRLGPVRLSDLAAEEGLNPTMLSRIAAKLETAGLVVRGQDAADGRVAFVSVSKDGRRLVERVRGERTDALSRVLDQLDAHELAILAEALPVLESVAQSLKDRSA
jgi:DNA-binding MarR family transcriptional regulator